MNAELPQLGDRLLVALFNGGYQGLLVTAAVWLCLKFLPRTNAATRYVVWGLALVTVVALPLLHFAFERRYSSPDWLLANQAQESSSVSSEAPPTRADPAKINPLVIDESQDLAFSPSAEIAEGKGVPKEQHYDSFTSRGSSEADIAPSIEAPCPDSEQPLIPSVNAEALVLEFPSDLLAPLSNPAVEVEDSGATIVRDSSIVVVQAANVYPAESESRFLGRETGAAPSVVKTTPDAEAPAPHRPGVHVVPFSLPRYAAPTILIALALLALARIAALIRQILLLREVKTASEPAPDPISKRYDSVCLSPTKKRPAKLLVSLEANSPMVVGFLRPAILIPKHLVESLQPAQLDPILRHELAHVRRFDDWANLAQQGVKALFGFHPAVLWICRRLSLEREIACDDYVLHSGQKARDYALFLTEFASHRNCRNWSAAPAAWSRKTQLKERVNMILKTDRSTSPRLGIARLGILSTTAAALAVAMLQLAPRLSAANQPALPKKPVASVQSADSAVIVGTSGESLVVGVPPAGNYPVVALNAPDAPPPPSAVIVGGSGESLVVGVPPAGNNPVVALAAPDAFAAAPATPSPRIASSGPRSKDSRRAPEAENADAAPGVAEPPVPPMAPAPDKIPSAPMPPHNKQYVAASSGSPDSSLEDRLRRVEQMLESLLHQRPYQVVVPKPIPHPEGQPDMKAFKFDWKMSHPSITWEKQAKQFEREAQLFSKKAELEAKRAAELSDADSKDRLSAAREKLEQQRHALESQRDALEKQLEEIEKQCDKIEQQQDKLQEEREKQEELKREHHNTSDNENEDESDELATH